MAEPRRNNGLSCNLFYRAKMGRLIGPKKTPQECGFKAGDSHLVLNAQSEELKAFDSTGKLIWTIPAIARGVNGHYDKQGGDTPPGLYKLGQIWDDRVPGGGVPAFTKERRSYGWITFDMIELEGQENVRGRAGICLHGGGTACGWPGAWAARQPLHFTHGCPRIHNEDSVKVLELHEQGTVFISLYQDY